MRLRLCWRGLIGSGRRSRRLLPGRADGEARKRKAYLKALEAEAQKFVNGYNTAKAINNEVNVLHRKFKDVVEECALPLNESRTASPI
jgi:hypothetical protein